MPTPAHDPVTVLSWHTRSDLPSFQENDVFSWMVVTAPIQLKDRNFGFTAPWIGTTQITSLSIRPPLSAQSIVTGSFLANWVPMAIPAHWHISPSNRAIFAARDWFDNVHIVFAWIISYHPPDILHGLRTSVQFMNQFYAPFSMDEQVAGMIHTEEYHHKALNEVAHAVHHGRDLSLRKEIEHWSLYRFESGKFIEGSPCYFCSAIDAPFRCKVYSIVACEVCSFKQPQVQGGDDLHNTVFNKDNPLPMPHGVDHATQDTS